MLIVGSMLGALHDQDNWKIKSRSILGLQCADSAINTMTEAPIQILFRNVNLVHIAKHIKYGFQAIAGRYTPISKVIGHPSISLG